MTAINPYLFVYGTLMNQEIEPAKSLMKRCSFFSKGKFPGKLYELGAYPGAVLSHGGADFVYGDVVFMTDVKQTLVILDDYEGFGDEQAQPNLYVRELVEVETIDGKLECWVYLYNLPVEGFKQIVSGKY